MIFAVPQINEIHKHRAWMQSGLNESSPLPPFCTHAIHHKSQIKLEIIIKQKSISCCHYDYLFENFRILMSDVLKTIIIIIIIKIKGKLEVKKK